MTESPEPKVGYCPFCGSNSTHLSYPGYGGRVQVMCDACEARGGIARTEKDAIKAWNKRTTPKQKECEKNECQKIKILPRSEI